MDGLPNMVNSVMKPLMDKEKYDIDSKERIASKRLEISLSQTNSEQSLIKIIVIIAFLVGAGISVLSFIFGKAELGIQIANTTISIGLGSLFGYIAGRTSGKKNAQDDN